MATVAAAITLGGWGWTKISPGVRHFLHHFWEYMAYVANALIFLLVGMQMNLAAMIEAGLIFSVVIVGMLIARAQVIFGLVPVVNRFSGSESVSRAYQTVMYWGGLRGAIALAIALSLGADFPYADTIIVVVTGAVLFTLLAQGLTIESLMRKLGLDQPTLGDRLSRISAEINANEKSLAGLPKLVSGGLFSQRIADKLEQEANLQRKHTKQQLNKLLHDVSDQETAFSLLMLQCLGTEKSTYAKLFNQSHIHKSSYRLLASWTGTVTDTVNHGGKMPNFEDFQQTGSLQKLVEKVVAKIYPAAYRSIRQHSAALDYDLKWARYRSAEAVLNELDQFANRLEIAESTATAIRDHFQRQLDESRQSLDQTTEQFPEFVNANQGSLGKRRMLQARINVIHHHEHEGSLPSGLAEEILEELDDELANATGLDVSKLEINLRELLKTVAFFSNLSDTDFEKISDRLQQHTVAAGEYILHQGDSGDSMYLITRGVVRVSVNATEGPIDVATLIAGDVIGEMSLLEDKPRTASCRAVTSCVLSRLSSRGFSELRSEFPAIDQALKSALEARKMELASLN